MHRIRIDLTAASLEDLTQQLEELSGNANSANDTVEEVQGLLASALERVKEARNKAPDIEDELSSGLHGADALVPEWQLDEVLDLLGAAVEL